MRRRLVLLGAAAAAFGGCSAREGGGADPVGSNTTRGATSEEGPDPPDGSAPPSPTSGEAEGTQVPETTAERETGTAVEAAREHLAAAFDELREMRPVGPETIRVSEDRFRASDHEHVRERVTAARRALERVGATDEGGSEPVPSLRAAIELAGAGLDLYAALREGIRAEWRFEHHCFGAEWADAREQADRAGRAVNAWDRHGRAVRDAVESVDAAGPVSVPRLSLEAWYRDGAVLGGVSGPWADVVAGFAAYAEAVRLDEAGLVAMDAGAYREAGGRFAGAAESMEEARRRLALAKADDAQGFQAYALPIRRRSGPFREAYLTQIEAAGAAVEGATDRAETLESKAMDRIVKTELEHPFPRP